MVMGVELFVGGLFIVVGLFGGGRLFRRVVVDGSFLGFKLGFRVGRKVWVCVCRFFNVYR